MSSEEVATLGREVKALLDQRRYVEALTNAEHYVAVAPQSARAWLAVSLAHQGLRHLPEALAAAEKAISLDAALAGPWQARGIILVELQRFAEAAPVLRQALERAPLVGSVWVNLGFALQREQRDEEALAAYDQAWKLRYQTAETLYGQVSTLSALRRPAEALSRAEEYVRRFPADVKAWRLRAGVLHALQRYEEALADFVQARQLEAPPPEVLEAEITAFCSLHRFAEALPLSEEFLRLAPTAAGAWWTRGRVLIGLARSEEALAAYARGRELQGAQAPTTALHGEITTYCALRRYAEALPLSEEYVRLAPDNAIAWGTHAAVLEGLHCNEEAVAAYDRALAIQPDMSWALDRKVALLWWSGHRREALRALPQSIALNLAKRRAARTQRVRQHK